MFPLLLYFKKNEVNYPVKLATLKNIYKLSRKGLRNKGDYDCIVGVSGSKDSTRQAQWARNRRALMPLIVSVAYPQDKCLK